jgi:glycosyltransferase involved in cell wall biosynthesis
VGISVLIPVYNYDVTALVQELASQLQMIGKKGEIIVLDDASDSPVSLPHKLLNDFSFISLHRNEKNEGRMLTRQRLSQLAQYEYLLFLDCDSEITGNDFLLKYFEQADASESLVVGGRVYSKDQPVDCDLVLHWKYGTKRESRKRNEDGSNAPAFMSNNFLVKQSVFNQLNFSLSLSGYGHEDTWWGIQLSELGINCKYINNHVLHAALEKANTFLDKAEKALANLLILEKNVNIGLLKKEVKIYKWYHRLKTSGLGGVYLFFEKPVHKYFRRNLLSCKPSLFYFDLYRLGQLIRAEK